MQAEGEYLAVDNGGHMRVNSLLVVIVAWLNAFHRRWCVDLSAVK